jgi:hypothetical protein
MHRHREHGAGRSIVRIAHAKATSRQFDLASSVAVPTGSAVSL